jgi:hypothetical protein
MFAERVANRQWLAHAAASSLASARVRTIESR